MFEPSKPNAIGSPKLYKTPQRGIKKDTQELECATENKENLYCENVLREKQQTPTKEVERLKNQLSQALAKAVAKNKKLTLSIQAEVENTRVANARIATLEEEITLLKSSQLAQERLKLEELEKKDNEIKKLASENHELKLQVNDLQSQLLAATETPVQSELPANADCENCQLLATRTQVLSTEFEKATIGHSVQKALAKALAKSNEDLKKENEELSASVAQIQQMGDHLQIVVETVSNKLANEHSLNQKLELQIKEFAQREQQATEELDQLTLQLDEHNQLCESMNEQLAQQNEQLVQQQEQVNDLEYQLAAHEALSRDAHVLCGLYDAVIADAKKETAQAKEIVSVQNEKLAKHEQQQRDNRVLRGLFESIVESQRHHLCEARKKVQQLSREVGLRRRELESEREARARGVLEHETKLLASYESTKHLYERQICEQRADFQECLDGLAEEKARCEAEHVIQIGLFEMVVESLKRQLAEREEVARIDQLTEVIEQSEIEIVTLPEATTQTIENASEEIAPAEFPAPFEPAAVAESQATPCPESRENEDLRIQIALFEAVIESLRGQVESYEERETQRELQRVQSQQQREKLLISPDKSANDSVLFKLHESARASEEQTAELLRLVRLLEEAATCERLAREEIEKKLALTVSEKEALLEQAVAITLEKEQLAALTQEQASNNNDSRIAESEIEFAAKLELERAQAQQRIDAVNAEWQQKMQVSSEQLAAQARQFEQQSSLQLAQAQREQSERLEALAREAEQSREEHTRAEVAKAFVCFEGKQRQFDCKVTELEQEIEMRKVINLSLQQEMEELKVLNVHLEIEQEKLDTLKSELSSRESLVVELRTQLESEQASLAATRIEMAKVEAAMTEMVRNQSELESSEQNLRAQTAKLELARSEMEVREQVRASELKGEMEKLQSMRAEMERRQSQIEDLKFQLQAMKFEMERRQGLLADLKSQLEASNAKAEDVRRECEARRAALNEREEELEKRQREFDERAATEIETAQESQQQLRSQVEELQALLERKTQLCVQLETENESMQLALVEQQSSQAIGESMSQKAVDNSEQLASLQQSLELVRNELETAHSELERKTTECQLLERDLAKSAQNVNIDKELKEMKELLRDARAEVAVEREERRREVEEKVAAKMAEAAQARERDEQQARFNQSLVALEEKEQCIQQLQIDLSELQSQLEQEKLKISVCLLNELEWQSEIAELESSLETLRSQQMESHETVNLSSERAREAEEKMAQLEASRVESEKRIDELQANIHYLEKKYSAECETKEATAMELNLTREKLAKRKTKLADLSADYDELAAEKAGAEESLARALEKCETKEATAMELSLTREKLETKLADLSEKYDKLVAEKAVAAESLARALEACAKHVNEREALQAKLEAAQGLEVRERDTALLKDATGTIERLKKELHDAFAKVSVAQEDVRAAHEKAEHYRALNEEGERQLLEMVKLSAMQPVPTLDTGKVTALVEEAREEEQSRYATMRDEQSAQHREALSAKDVALQTLTSERDELRRAVDELNETKTKLEEEMEALKQQHIEKADAQEKEKEEKERQEQEDKEKEEQEDVRKTIAFMRHNLSINTRELERLKGLIKGRDDVIMQLRSQINELEEFEMVNQQLKEQLQQKEKEFNVINVKNKKLQSALQQSQGETNRSQKELSEASTWQQQTEEAHAQIRILQERHAAQEREIERLLEVEATQEAGNDQSRKENFLKMKKEINSLKAEVSRLQESQYTQSRQGARPSTTQATSTRSTGALSGTLSSAYASNKSATNTNGTMKTTTSTLRSNIPKK